jgi:hypothetical protein
VWRGARTAPRSSPAIGSSNNSAGLVSHSPRRTLRPTAQCFFGPLDGPVRVAERARGRNVDRLCRGGTDEAEGWACTFTLPSVSSISGMWQEIHWLPALSNLWCVWAGMLSANGSIGEFGPWRPRQAHCPFPEASRRCRCCGDRDMRSRSRRAALVSFVMAPGDRQGGRRPVRLSWLARRRTIDQALGRIVRFGRRDRFRCAQTQHICRPPARRRQ